MLSERELESRYEVFVEQYVTKLNIEAETAADIARTMLLPAALQYIGAARRPPGRRGRRAPEAEIVGSTDEFVETIFALEEANAGHPETEDVLEAAKYVQSTVIPAMEAAREVADRLERIVARLALAAAEVLGDPVHQVAPAKSGRSAEGPGDGALVLLRGRQRGDHGVDLGGALAHEPLAGRAQLGDRRRPRVVESDVAGQLGLESVVAAVGQ